MGVAEAVVGATSPRVTTSCDVDRVQADVLVIGGVPAGTWAAIRAAEAGAGVVLADKAYAGASGVTASAGTGVWYVVDVPQLRDAAIAHREKVAAGLTERSWMERVLDETYTRIDELATVQRYPLPAGVWPKGGLLGPEYMRRQRLRAQRLGDRIVDHTPDRGVRGAC